MHRSLIGIAALALMVGCSSESAPSSGAATPADQAKPAPDSAPKSVDAPVSKSAATTVVKIEGMT